MHAVQHLAQIGGISFNLVRKRAGTTTPTCNQAIFCSLTFSCWLSIYRGLENKPGISRSIPANLEEFHSSKPPPSIVLGSSSS